MEAVRTFGSSVRDATADALNPINNAIKSATPDTPGSVPFFLQQQIIEASCEAQDPGRDHWKYINLRLESGGAHSVSKTLAILKTMLQQGPPSFSFLVKGSTHNIVKLATADTRKDSVEEQNKQAAQQVLATIGQPVSEAQMNMHNRMGGFSSDNAPRTDPMKPTSGKTAWEEMQAQKSKDQRRKDKEKEAARAQAIEDRAAELRKAQLTFNIEESTPEQVTEKLVGGTRKRVPASELKAFGDALTDSHQSHDTLATLAKRLQEPSIVTRMKVLEAVVHVLKNGVPHSVAVVTKYQKRLCSIRDARPETGLEKKTEHCAALATEALQLLESPPPPRAEVVAVAEPEPQQPAAAVPASGGFSFVTQAAPPAAAAAAAAAPVAPVAPAAVPPAQGDAQAQALAQLLQQQQMLQQLMQQASGAPAPAPTPAPAPAAPAAPAAADPLGFPFAAQSPTPPAAQPQAAPAQDASLQALLQQQQALAQLQQQQAELQAAEAQQKAEEEERQKLLAQQAQLQQLMQAQQQAQQAAQEAEAQAAEAARAQAAKQAAEQAQSEAAMQAQLAAIQEQQKMLAALQAQQAQQQQQQTEADQRKLLAEKQQQLAQVQQMQQQHEAMQQLQQPNATAAPKLHIPTPDDIFSAVPALPASKAPAPAPTQAATGQPLRTHPTMDPFASLMEPAAAVPNHLATASNASTCGSPLMPFSPTSMLSPSGQGGNQEAFGLKPVETEYLNGLQKQIGSLQAQLKPLQVAYNNAVCQPENTPLPDFAA